MGKVDKDRFSGFPLLYNQSRPEAPAKVVDIVLAYLERPADLVADLGSGTGLSSSVWLGRCGRVVGIEPTADMRTLAQQLYPTISFLEADSYDTTLPSASVDVVTCSQSFHWMEPRETLEEIDRILRPGGVLAVYDCQWPVSYSWEAERAHRRLYEQIDAIVARDPVLASQPKGFPKEHHRKNIEDSRRFRYITEVLFDNVEDCGPNRFAEITLSQGYLQSLVKAGNKDIEGPLRDFLAVCARQQAAQMRVSYRAILGKK